MTTKIPHFTIVTTSSKVIVKSEANVMFNGSEAVSLPDGEKQSSGTHSLQSVVLHFLMLGGSLPRGKIVTTETEKVIVTMSTSPPMNISFALRSGEGYIITGHDGHGPQGYVSISEAPEKKSKPDDSGFPGGSIGFGPSQEEIRARHERLIKEAEDKRVSLDDSVARLLAKQDETQAELARLQAGISQYRESTTNRSLDQDRTHMSRTNASFGSESTSAGQATESELDQQPPSGTSFGVSMSMNMPASAQLVNTTRCQMDFIEPPDEYGPGDSWVETDETCQDDGTVLVREKRYTIRRDGLVSSVTNEYLVG